MHPATGRSYDAWMASAREDSSWNIPDRGLDREDLVAPSTQVVADREAYLGQGGHDVGRRISDDQVELFISADVAGSLQQAFSQHRPDFIALHDLGTSASLRLLTSLAGAAGARVQRLVVRRQGHGVALATLQFLEVPRADASPVRLYSSDLGTTDAQARQQVARVLLANSRLGVLLIGELPPHVLTTQLAPLHESLMRGIWPNRDLLMVPIGSSAALATQAAQLASGSQVEVHVTPQAGKPKQAWAFISGAWNRLNGHPLGAHMLASDLAHAVAPPRLPDSEAATQPMPLDPLARATPGGTAPPWSVPRPAGLPVTEPTPMPVPGATLWQTYVDRCALIKGALGCCVFDLHSARALAHAGANVAADRLAQQGATLLGHMGDTARALGLGGGHAEATLSTTSHHLLLRPVPGHPGIALHLLLSGGSGNLTLARMQLERIEPPR